MREQLYTFDFTEKQIEVIKHALAISGLEFCNNREIYSLLCEAVCDEWDRKELARYN